MVQTSMTARRPIAWPIPVAGALLLVADGLGFLFSLVLLSWGCEDYCEKPTLPGWFVPTLLGTPVIAALAALAGIVFAARRTPRAAVVSLGLSVAAAFAWYVLVFG
jgi:hypothetical protein